MMMLIPEAWENMPRMDPELRAFYQYHACLQEPWDGPAAVAFTDGEVAAAIMDRNGLRPARYQRTRDGLVVMGSEVGLVDLEFSENRRLGPDRAGRDDRRRHAATALPPERADQARDRRAPPLPRVGSTRTSTPSTATSTARTATTASSPTWRSVPSR